MREKKSIFLTDSPNIEEDSFQIHTNIAETLFEIITKHDVRENSFNIGLFGEWGSGKSFIINKLAEKIRKNKINTTYLYIDTWKYSGFPLLRSILFDLDKQFIRLYQLDNEKYNAFSKGYEKNGHSLDFQLKFNKHLKEESKLTPKESWKKIFETLKKYKIVWILLIAFLLIFLAPLLLSETFKESDIYKNFNPFVSALKSFFSFTGIGVVILVLMKKPIEDIGNLVFFRSIIRDYTEQANFSPEQFEDIFKDMLGKIENEKYVIIFDNIDRCEPDVAYETLSTIKTFMDIENCFYIIPADDDAIKNYLSKSKIKENEGSSFERKFAEEFIDKIFQTYIRIPTLKEVERDKYIKEQLTKIDFQSKLTDDDIETITQILYFAYKGESPRNIIRFINDYSTYFHLALKSLPKLLDDIMLFTIMIAIKQKWYHFEKILLDNPDFFEKYPSNKELIKNIENNNAKELERFLDSIQSFYIPQIKNNAIDMYIHFKESEKSFEISDKLKNNQPDELILNEENIKILIREFRKIVTKKGQFSINSFLTFAKLISNNDEDKFTKKIIIEFWLGIIDTPQEQIKSIFQELFDEGLLIDIFNSLDNQSLKSHNRKVEEVVLNYFKEPLENDKNYDEFVKIFEIIISSQYKINADLLKQLFGKWKKESLYLNSLLKIISVKEKPEYLPNNVFRELISKPIDDKSIEILNNWTHTTISKPLGIKLAKIVLERIGQRNFANFQQLAHQQSNIEQDYELTLLLDLSFIESSKMDDFINSISNLTSRVFQFATDQQPFLDLGIRFWIETAYFSSANPELIDNQLLNTFTKFIKPNSTALQLLIDKTRYSENILSLQKTKQSIFNTSSELQKALYQKLENENFNNLELTTSIPIENGHINVLLDYLDENKIDLNKTKFSGFLLEEVIKESISRNTDISKKLKFLRESFDLKEHKKLILDYKNGLIDYYKNKLPNAQIILNECKSILSYSDFFNKILKPILNFIKAKLEQGEDIKDFNNISLLIETTNNKSDINLLFSIAKQCLEKSQNLEENYLGIGIIEKIYDKISIENSKEIKSLIANNDHYYEWASEKINILKSLGIIVEEKND